jgi:type II restriction enzyme
LNILNSLIGTKDFYNEFRNIIIKYPEVLPVIPLLLAVREIKLKIIKDFVDEKSDIFVFNFNPRKLNKIEIEELLNFFEKTGLKDFFENFANKSLIDYLTGIEVGLDTHARKNRSGDAMEILLKPIIEKINDKMNKKYNILFQKKFKELKKFDLKVPSSLLNRKADFILFNNRKVLNIEVNFYSGTGSKPQEIVNSYINRQDELLKNNFKFIWITDGEGWKGQINQIKYGFERINYLLNLHFVRKGFLEYILWKI